MNEFIELKPVNDIPVVPLANLESTGNFFAYDGTGVLKRTPVKALIDYVNSDIKGIATQANAPTVYDAVTYPDGLVEKWEVVEPISTSSAWYTLADAPTKLLFPITAPQLEDNYIYFHVTNGVVTLDSKPTKADVNNYNSEYITNNNITQTILGDASVISEDNLFNTQVAGVPEVSLNTIRRISKATKQILNYVEVAVNEDGDAISDTDVDGTGFFIKEDSKYYVQIFDAVIDVRNLGIVADGTDQSVKFNAILKKFKNVGASFIFPTEPQPYVFAQQIIFPYSIISNTPTQKPFKIVGGGSYWNGKSIGNNGKKGSTIALNYQGNGTYLDAKIISYGLGKLTFEDITFEDLTGNATPFFYGTFTTWAIRKCAFLGSKYGLDCDQDVFVFGGTDLSEVGNNPNGGFQGYGTVISENYFSNIRRGILGQNYFNGSMITDNTFWFECGNANGGAIEFDGINSVQSCTGNVISGNLVEMIHYKHFFKGIQVSSNSFIGNNLFDIQGNSTSFFDFSTNSKFNMIITGWNEDSIPLITGDKEQTIITSHQGQSSYISDLKVKKLHIDTDSTTISEGLFMGLKDSAVKWFDRYVKSIKTIQKIRRNDDDSEDIFMSIKDYNDGYYSFVFGGVNPRIDANPDAGMKFRAGNNQELFLGDLAGQGVTVLNNNLILKPTAEGYNNSLFIDSADGKLKFKDSLGTINPLY